MNEAAIAAWLSAHPFWHTEIILMLGAVSGLAKADWERFKRHQADDPAIAFNWRVAVRQYSKAIVIATVPPLVAMGWRVLAAAPPVLAFIYRAMGL